MAVKSERRKWCGVMTAVGLAVVASRAAAMTYRPISDENLVAASALVVIAEVEQVRAAHLADGRIVTQTDLRVDTTLKGAVTAPHIRVTEPGGRVGSVIVRIPGVPAFVPGERTLLFLREGGDGTLGTTALSLAKYTITAEAPVLARRTVPDLDERQLDAFAARIRTLAGGASGRVVSDGFGGAPATVIDVRTDAFTLLGDGSDCDPVASAGCVGGRWHEARCGEPMVYATSGSDDGVGPNVSRQAVQAGLAAWSSAPGSFLDLMLGPELPAVPSALAFTSFADFDGQNVVQFGDPFDIVPDLVGCQGVLALGGTVSTAHGRVVEGETGYDRTLEGDVVVNEGVGACVGEDGLAETVAHEIGHTLGFGHSSENPLEPDAELRDALMYFQIHDDGRGASLRADDLAAMAFVYPPLASGPTPAAEGLGDVACLLDLELCSSACYLDFDGRRCAPSTARKRAAKAGRAARKALRASNPSRAMRALAKADQRLTKAENKLVALETAGALRAECLSTLEADVARRRARVAEVRTLVGEEP
jgi:hypothetical protein